LQKIGLALGSGSARGFAHIGVINSIRDAGIRIDVVCGSSIGALVGGALAGNFLTGLEEMARQLTWPDIIKFMDFLFPRSGFIEGDRITNYFREQFTDAKIENLPLPFAAVATDIMNGKEIWLQKGSLMDAIRASFSMPGIFTPCKNGEQWLVDGGLVNPVPVSLCRAMGADIVVAVNLNSDIIGLPRYINRKNRENGNGKTAKNSGKISQFINSRLIPALKRTEEKMTEEEISIFDVIAASVNIMQDRMTKQRLAGDPPDLLITPRLADIGLLEFNRAAEAIEEGRVAMSYMVPLLKEMAEEKREKKYLRKNIQEGEKI